jgi:hypothetical protein
VAVHGETLADYSCGGSAGIEVNDLAPASLFIPWWGTINGTKYRANFQVA